MEIEKNQYFIGLLKPKKRLPPSPRSEAKAVKFSDPILTNFPIINLKILLGPGRVFHKLSKGLGFI